MAMQCNDVSRHVNHFNSMTIAELLLRNVVGQLTSSYEVQTNQMPTWGVVLSVCLFVCPYACMSLCVC